MARTLRLISLAAVTWVATACTDDVFDASYATQSAAVAAGAIERGWIPTWVPTEATQLREVHNVDTNQSALLFSLPSRSTWRPPRECDPAVAGEFSEPAFSRDWFPDVERGYDLFVCPGERPGAQPQLYAGLAISRSRQQVFHWRMLAR
jgi:hypothetical protein